MCRNDDTQPTLRFTLHSDIADPLRVTDWDNGPDQPCHSLYNTSLVIYLPAAINATPFRAFMDLHVRVSLCACRSWAMCTTSPGGTLPAPVRRYLHGKNALALKWH